MNPRYVMYLIGTDIFILLLPPWLSDPLPDYSMVAAARGGGIAIDLQLNDA